MPAELHETSLIALLAVGFALALWFGLVASTFEVSPIVGLAGQTQGIPTVESNAGRDPQVNRQGTQN